MKYTLSTDDKEEHLTWLNGWRYQVILDELKNWIRSELKYNPKLKPLEAKTLEKVREKIFEIEKELEE
jgi:hypothetical protein